MLFFRCFFRRIRVLNQTNLKYRTLCDIDSKADHAIMQNVLDHSSMDAKVALIECQNSISRIKETDCNDKYLYDVMTYTSPFIASILSKEKNK